MRNKNAKVTDPNKFYTCPGSNEHILYSGKVLPDGTIHLTECGKENIQEIINSAAETCDMAYILHELALGNTSVLNQRETFYGDFSKAPNSLLEAMQIMLDGEKAFMALPLEVRQKFDNSYMLWLSTNGSEEWIEKMAIKHDTEEVNEEVKEGETV